MALSTPLSLDEYQRRAARTLEADKPSGSLAVVALGLAGESGEIVDHVKKFLGHGHTLDGPKTAEEIGDLLWYVAGLCTLLELNLGDVAAANVNKLLERYPEGFSEERSRNRVDRESYIEGSFPPPPQILKLDSMARPMGDLAEIMEKRNHVDQPKPTPEAIDSKIPPGGEVYFADFSGVVIGETSEPFVSVARALEGINGSPEARAKFVETLRALTTPTPAAASAIEALGVPSSKADADYCGECGKDNAHGEGDGWKYVDQLVENASKIDAQILALNLKLDLALDENRTLRADVEAAAGELLVPIPDPGTDAARMLLANRKLMRQRDEARLAFARADMDSAQTITDLREDSAEAFRSQAWLTDEAVRERDEARAELEITLAGLEVSKAQTIAAERNRAKALEDAKDADTVAAKHVQRAATLESVLREVLAASEAENAGTYSPGDAPGHIHKQYSGNWDSDHADPEKAGKPCEWCAAYKAARAMLTERATGADK